MLPRFETNQYLSNFKSKVFTWLYWKFKQSPRSSAGHTSLQYRTKGLSQRSEQHQKISTNSSTEAETSTSTYNYYLNQKGKPNSSNICRIVEWSRHLQLLVGRRSWLRLTRCWWGNLFLFLEKVFVWHGNEHVRWAIIVYSCNVVLVNVHITNISAETENNNVLLIEASERLIIYVAMSIYRHPPL